MRSWIIGVAIVVLGGGAILYKTLGRSDANHELQTVAVKTGPITMTIETNGTVQPLTTVEVGCEVSGKIDDLLAEPDQPVKKDEIICKINPELAEAEDQQSQADLAKAKSAVADAELGRDEQIANLPVHTLQALAQKEQAEAALVDAEYSWNRVDKLHGNSDATDTEWVATKARWLQAQANAKAAQAAYDLAVNNERILPGRAEQLVEQAKAALKLAEARANYTNTRVNRCTIRAPIDGIVLKRYFDVGTTVNATFQTPPLYLLAPSLDRMKVSARVSESDIAHIEVGQKARFTVEARQPITFEDRIKHKYNQPESIQNVVTYTVDFEVKNDARHTLIPGLSVNVEILCVEKPETLQIPNTALRFNPPLSMEDRRAIVESVTWPPRPTVDANGQEVAYCSKAHAWQFDEKDKKWIALPLWIGITDNVNTEIVAGAKPGDTFVKKYIDQSKDGFNFKDAMKLASPENRTL
ncbi:MAG TPA: efflux RND transporter periplasmic adaptor subunit [Phycisphaerae bacterium]|nr:efflux RND transporter periplasmic adaptor subunit [Phycisphaerae bacterium]